MRKVLFAFAALLISLPVFATPCMTGTFASISGQTCTIGALTFSFGTPSGSGRIFDYSTSANTFPVLSLDGFTFTPVFDATHAGFEIAGDYTITAGAYPTMQQQNATFLLPYSVQVTAGTKIILGFTDTVDGSVTDPLPTMFYSFGSVSNSGGKCFLTPTTECITVQSRISQNTASGDINTPSGTSLLPDPASQSTNSPYTTQFVLSAVAFNGGSATLKGGSEVYLLQAPVPEPASLAFVLTGVLVLTGRVGSRLPGRRKS